MISLESIFYFFNLIVRIKKIVFHRMIQLYHNSFLRPISCVNQIALNEPSRKKKFLGCTSNKSKLSLSLIISLFFMYLIQHIQIQLPFVTAFFDFEINSAYFIHLKNINLLILVCYLLKVLLNKIHGEYFSHLLWKSTQNSNWIFNGFCFLHNF